MKKLAITYDNGIFRFVGQEASLSKGVDRIDQRYDKTQSLGFLKQLGVKEPATILNIAETHGMAEASYDEEISKSDLVREYVNEYYVVPARDDAKETIEVVVGDVAMALKLEQRLPLVRGALATEKFTDEYGLRRINSTGTGPNEKFLFVIDGSPK